MTNRIFSFLLILTFVFSCSSDKINISPLRNSVTDATEGSRLYNYSERKELIIYSSEITNLIATFPKFKSDAVNNEVKNLKYHLKDYIGALEAYNFNGLNIAQRNFEKSYKKLQKLRKYLNGDEDAVLNRYLVRIKTNMTLLDSNTPTDQRNTTSRR